MVNARRILSKIARDAEMLGLTVNSNTGTEVVIDDGINDILVEFDAADLQDPMGGVSPATAPFLGAGHAAPGKLVLSKNAAGNQTIDQVFDTIETAQVLAILAGTANNILIMDGNEGVGTAAVLVEIAGNPDLKMMGQ